jgi:hypothetical protein
MTVIINNVEFKVTLEKETLTPILHIHVNVEGFEDTKYINLDALKLAIKILEEEANR